MGNLNHSVPIPISQRGKGLGLENFRNYILLLLTEYPFRLCYLIWCDDNRPRNVQQSGVRNAVTEALTANKRRGYQPGFDDNENERQKQSRRRNRKFIVDGNVEIKSVIVPKFVELHVTCSNTSPEDLQKLLKHHFS